MKETATFTLGEIASQCGGEILFGEGEFEFTSVCSDSREIDVCSLFVPIIGEKFDGHSFIEELSRDGRIKGFITSRKSDRSTALMYSMPSVLVHDTLSALGTLGKICRQRHMNLLIGITGTNGKTTTKELLSKILAAKFNVHKNEKNYNNEIGVPFALMKLNSAHEISVIEMGMNHPGELARLSAVTLPDCAIVTNAGEGHLEFLGSVENVARAKSEIFSTMKAGSPAFINIESECSDILIEEAKKKSLKVITYSINQPADITPSAITLGSASVGITLDGENYSAPLYGLHNAHNLTVAVAVALHYGVEPALIRDGLKNFVNADKRSQIIEKDFVMLNDTYNSNPLSLRYALKSLAMIYPERRKIAILADMKELGDAARECHENSGRELAALKFDSVYTFGEMAKYIGEAAARAGLKTENVKHFTNKEELKEFAKSRIKPGDAVLVKGSRSMKMEEVADFLVC